MEDDRENSLRETLAPTFLPAQRGTFQSIFRWCPQVLPLWLSSLDEVSVEIKYNLNVTDKSGWPNSSGLGKAILV